MISIDLPFHGKTNWNEGLLLKPTELLEIMNSIIPQENSLVLMGYSMGGRVCLQLLASFPQRFHKLVLLAPDGLHRNFWQRLSTQTKIGNRLFAFSMRYPGWMFVLMRLTGFLGLFNKSIIRFVHHYLDHEQERKILYQRWTTMRLFRPAFSVLKKIIRAHNKAVYLIFGKYDRVIVASHGYRLQQGIDAHVTVTELMAGHHLLQEKYKKEILLAAKL